MTVLFTSTYVITSETMQSKSKNSPAPSPTKQVPTSCVYFNSFGAVSHVPIPTRT